MIFHGSVSRSVSSFSTAFVKFSSALPGAVQPACTIEVLPVLPRQRRTLDSLRPFQFLQFFTRPGWQVMIN